MEVVWTDTEAHNGKEDKTASKRVPHHTKKDKDIIRKAIQHWRAIIWKHDFSTEGFSFYSLKAVMSDHILETLVSKCAKVCAADSIDSFLNWIPRKPEYIQDLTNILMASMTPLQLDRNTNQQVQNTIMNHSVEVDLSQHFLLYSMHQHLQHLHQQGPQQSSHV